MLPGKPVTVKFTKMIANGPRQIRVGVAPEDDNIPDHVVKEVKLVGVLDMNV